MKFLKFVTSKYGLITIAVIVALIAIWAVTIYLFSGLIVLVIHIVIPIAIVLVIYFYVRKWLKERKKE